MFGKGEVVEPRLQLANGHFHKVGDGKAVYLNPGCLFFQSRAMALRTNRLATVATHHHPVLNLVLVFLHHAEECVKANSVVFQFTVFASV